jgi:CIC family chloride channel protein
MDGRRWYSEQPNVTGRGIVAGYSLRFWAIVAGLGAVTGAGAAGLIGLLHLVAHLAYGYSAGSFLEGVTHAAAWRHFLALGIAAGLVALGVLVLGRVALRGGAHDVTEGLWLRDARLPLVPSAIRAVLSIVTVGLGSTLGREGAPQVFGAAVATRLAEWARMPTWQRRLLVACGAGSGFAAVYNVPLGGAVFAVEVLLGSLALPLVLPAITTSVIATAVAWAALGTGPTYHLPHYALHPEQMVWALLAGPIIGVIGIGWVRLLRGAAHHQPTGRARYTAPLAAFMLLAALSIPYPQLLGNGKGIVQLGALGGLSLGLMVVLFVLKPIVTAACLGSGAPGGLFTPTLTVGVLLAGILGTVWSHIWPGAAIGSYAVIGGGAFLAAAMQGPIAGVVLVLELTRNFDALMAPTLLAVAEATVIARRLGAPSIYSARLRPEPDDAAHRTPAGETLARLDAPSPFDAPAPPDERAAGGHAAARSVQRPVSEPVEQDGEPRRLGGDEPGEQVDRDGVVPDPDP